MNGRRPAIPGAIGTIQSVRRDPTRRSEMKSTSCQRRRDDDESEDNPAGRRAAPLATKTDEIS